MSVATTETAKRIVQLNIRLTEADIQRLRDVARKREMPLSWVVRSLIREAAEHV